MTKVVGYVRVSTEEQSISVEAQKAKLEAYASLYDLNLVETIVDCGISGKTLDRPGIQKALGMLTTGNADGLLIVKLDRLTRNVSDLGYLLSNYFEKNALMSVSEQFDTRTAAGRLVLNVMASVSQWERETIAERTKTALQFKKSQGQRVGQVPYGYSLATDGVTLEKNESEQQVIAVIHELRGAGLSIRAIVNELNKRGITSRKGTALQFEQVRRIIAA